MMYYRISKIEKILFFGKKIAQVWAVTLNLFFSKKWDFVHPAKLSSGLLSSGILSSGLLSLWAFVPVGFCPFPVSAGVDIQTLTTVLHRHCLQ